MLAHNPTHTLSSPSRRHLFEEDSGKDTPERGPSAPGTGPSTRMGSGGGSTPSHHPLHLHDRDRENDVEGGGDTRRLAHSSLDGRDVTLGGRYLGGGGGSGRNLEMASTSGMERVRGKGRACLVAVRALFIAGGHGICVGGKV